MTTLSVDGVYENGVLKLDHPLPLKEQQRVLITVESPSDWVKRTSGMFACSDPALIQRVALDVSLEYEQPDVSR